jgi:LemA protein
MSHSLAISLWAKHERANGGFTIMVKWIGLGILGLVVVMFLAGIGSYNGLVSLEQGVRAQWGQVENVYQRRAELIPNLVETVKGAANFEKETLTQITQARAQVGQISSQATQDIINNPQQFEKFQQAQSGLSSALSRLLVVAEKYPELKATQNFRDLQAQLEGTENRISVERMRFNEAAQAFNTKRSSFPTVVIANFFGNRFAEKPYFKAREGSDVAPTVKF